MADITDLQIGQGETFKILIQLQNRSENNTPIDISDYDFTGQVRENYTTEEIAATFAFEQIGPPESGSVFVSLTPEQTEALDQRSYVYDIKINTESATRRILEGRFVVRPAVTR